MYGLATANSRNPLAAYNRVAIDNTVETASPHKLIQMLFDAASLHVATALAAMASGDIPGKGKAISRAIQIIDGGLFASLNKERGGDLAVQLGDLYTYMSKRLMLGNLHNDRAALQEVAKLLNDIGGAWAEIANDPAVLRYNGSNS